MVKREFKYGVLEHTDLALRQLLNQDLPLKVGYAALRTRKNLSPALEAFQKKQRDVLGKFCKIDPLGRPLPGTDGQIQWHKNGEERYMKAIEEEGEKTVEIDVYQCRFHGSFRENDRIVAALLHDLDFLFFDLYDEPAEAPDA